MDWGIPTLIEAPGLEESAALCRELGFQFVELNMNLPEYQQWDIAQLKDIANRYGIYYTIHLDERMDLGDFNPRIAQAYLQTLLDTIEAAKQLEIPILNMHLLEGVYFTLPDKKHYLYDSHGEHFLRQLSSAIACCEDAAEGKLSLCIENTGVFSLSFLQKALLTVLKRPFVGLTYDIGASGLAAALSHSRCTGTKKSFAAGDRGDRAYWVYCSGREKSLPRCTGSKDRTGTP